MKKIKLLLMCILITYVINAQLPYSWTSGVNPGWANTGPLQWRAGCGYVTTNCTGNYNNNVNTFYTSPVISANCPNATTINVTFTAFGNIENLYDFMFIEYSLDGGIIWINPYGVNVGWTGNFGTSPGMTIPPITIPTSNNIMFRFNFRSDGIVTYSGLKITDFDITCNVVMPVELLSFTGENIGGENILNWVTASERNNDFFTIERSIDGVDWEIIKYIDGAGTTTSGNMYELIDENYKSVINYYRLSQTDFDGTKEVFNDNIITIDNRLNAENIETIFNLLGQKVDINYQGIKVIKYKNGEIIKKY